MDGGVQEGSGGEDEPVLTFEEFVNIGQNLVSVLNDPRASLASDVFFDSISTFMEGRHASTALDANRELPNIGLSDFRQYLQDVGQPFRQFQSNKTSTADLSDSSNSWFNQSSLADSITACAQTVPSMFFEQDFPIQERETFASIYPEETQESPIVLQEKLTQYLDLVEVNLLKQLASRSDSFFAALHNFQELHDQVKVAVAEVSRIRQRIKHLDEVSCKESLKIAQLRRNRANVAVLCRKLKLMETVGQTQPTIQLLLTSSDFVGALDLIQTTQEVLATELVGVEAFRALEGQLKEALVLVETMMKEEFLKIALETPLVSTSKGGPLDLPEDVSYQLSAVTMGLLKIKKLRPVQDQYRELLAKDVKQLVKDGLAEAMANEPVVTDSAPPPPESSGDGETQSETPAQHQPPAPPSLADRLKSLAPDRFNSILTSLFEPILYLLNRVSAVHRVVKATTEKEEVVEAASDAMLAEVAAAMRETTDATCDIAHNRCSRLLNVRQDVTSTLPLAEFVHFFETVLSFITASENLCGKQGLTLRNSLLQQSKAFMAHFHNSRVESLTLVLENESWAKTDIPAQVQKIVHRLVSGEVEALDAATDASDEGDGEMQKDSMLDVGGKNYNVVGSVLILVKMLEDYTICARKLPAMSTDVLQKVGQILKRFNSTSCQLVLGAGAMKLAGLKSINAKHLALTSQCVSVLIALVPFLRAHLERSLPPKQKMFAGELERVVMKDFTNHLSELYVKLASLIRVSHHSQAIEAINWEDGDQSPPAYITSIMKEVASLNKVLGQLLTQDLLREHVYSRIVAIADKTLSEKYLSLNLTSEKGKAKLFAHIEFYKTCWSKLKIKAGEQMEAACIKQFGTKPSAGATA